MRERISNQRRYRMDKGIDQRPVPFEFLNKNIIISWNNGKVEGQENRITTFTDLGKRETEDIDLNTIGIPQEGESYCYPQIGHLYFVHKHGKVLLEYRTLRIFLSHRISPKSRGNRYSFIGIYTFRLGMDRSILKFHRGDFI